MACPLVSVSGVLVSLQVITMHPIDLGAWDVCSVWLGVGIEMVRQEGRGRRQIRSSPIVSSPSPLSCFYFQTESGFSLATGFPPWICSSMMVATSASVTLEYQVASG